MMTKSQKPRQLTTLMEGYSQDALSASMAKSTLKLRSASERISDSLAEYIRENDQDYPPVAVMTTEFIHRFGTVTIDDVPEVQWVRYLSDCEAGRFWA